jgi:hypothetical protein
MRYAWLGLVLSFVSVRASAAELPPHEPLRVLVVSDSVNPNGLSDAELTQAGDLEVALAGPNTGLEVAEVLEVDSQCVDEALAGLAEPGAYTTLIYFAHRSARRCDDSDGQVALTAAVEAFLIAGGGVVMFHHGVYQDAGKEALLQLLGGTAGSIQWDVNSGQNVLNVADGHFVTSNSVEYTGMAMYADMQNGVPAGQYPYFNNTPDERYPALQLLKMPGETRTVLFASDYDNNGTVHTLGYDLQRPGWAGRVVFYQPAEYQPHALDDVDGNNFQILANALVHVTPAGEPPMETSGETGEPETSGETGGETGETDTPETTVPGETGGGPSDPNPGETGEEPTGNGETANGEAGDETVGLDATGDGSTSGVTVSGGPTSATDTAGESMDDGCGCRASGAPGYAALLGLLLMRRRTRRGWPALTRRS